MHILNGSTDKLQLITGSAADVECLVSWVEIDNASPPVVTDVDNTPTASITTATTTDILTCGANRRRKPTGISIFNNHASTSTLVTLQHTDGTTVTVLWEGTLLANESVVIGKNGVPQQFDATGLLKLSSYPVATQADQEAGTSLTTFVPPGRQHFHPSAAKCWVEGQANSTTILASYNITSLADTATGTQTVTIATDFSNANWCCNVTRSEDDLTLVYSSTYNAKTAGVVAMNSVVEAGSGSDPTSSSGNASWSMVGFGDHA